MPGHGRLNFYPPKCAEISNVFERPIPWGHAEKTRKKRRLTHVFPLPPHIFFFFAKPQGTVVVIRTGKTVLFPRRVPALGLFQSPGFYAQNATNS
jgi:hypothetical protein